MGRFDEDGQTLAEAHVRERFGVTVVAVNSASGEVLVNPAAVTVSFNNSLYPNWKIQGNWSNGAANSGTGYPTSLGNGCVDGTNYPGPAK